MNTKLISKRKHEGLTQVEVAEKADISESAYQNYESGRRVPNVTIAKRIAQILQCKIEDIF